MPSYNNYRFRLTPREVRSSVLLKHSVGFGSSFIRFQNAGETIRGSDEELDLEVLIDRLQPLKEFPRWEEYEPIVPHKYEAPNVDRVKINLFVTPPEWLDEDLALDNVTAEASGAVSFDRPRITA